MNKKYHYVYRITNIKHKKHYYGVRSSKIKPINDLGIKYFSSSTDKQFIIDQKNNPQNYKYIIVLEFNSRKEALELEVRLHNKFNVCSNKSFYNKSRQTSNKFDTTGLKFTLSEDAKKKISKALKNKPKSKTHIENAAKNGMRGRKQSENAKKLMSINKTGDKNPMSNKNHTKESINKMKMSSANPSERIRQNLKNGWEKRKLITCPICGLTSNNKGNMTRWHFNNCKKK